MVHASTVPAPSQEPAASGITNVAAYLICSAVLNQREVPTRTRQSRWERPTIWRMLHNPAYAGHAPMALS
jgi:Recombinase